MRPARIVEACGAANAERFAPLPHKRRTAYLTFTRQNFDDS